MLNNSENLEKLFSTMGNTAERLWEISLVTLGSMAWNQDQVETLMKNYLDQRKMARAEGTKLMEEITNRARTNQQQFQKMIEESMVGIFGSLSIPKFNYLDDLTKRVDDLSNKVDHLQEY